MKLLNYKGHALYCSPITGFMGKEKFWVQKFLTHHSLKVSLEVFLTRQFWLAIFRRAPLLGKE